MADGGYHGLAGSRVPDISTKASAVHVWHRCSNEFEVRTHALRQRARERKFADSLRWRETDSNHRFPTAVLCQTSMPFIVCGDGSRCCIQGYRFRSAGHTQTPSSSKQSVSLQISPSFPEKPGFSASVGRMPEGAVGRDAQVQQHRAEEPVVSLSGDISVPQRRRCGSRRWGRRRQARLRRSRFSNIDKA